MNAVLRLLDRRWYPFVLIAIAAALGVAMHALVYPDLSWNRDEPVFLWQADLLLDGQLTQTDGGFPTIFHPWLSAHSDGRFFSQYPLAWPAAIAVGKALGSSVVTLAASTALFIGGAWVFARELTGSRRRAGAAATLLLLSPITAVQSGVYLNYLFTAGLGALFAAAVLRSVRTGSRRFAAFAGGLLGIILLTRPFDAVIWAMVMGGFLLVTERERIRGLLRLLPAVAATFLPLVVIQLLHNRWTTGSVTTFAMTVADPLDTFGFGERRMMPALDTYRHTPLRALRDTIKHLFFLPWFLIGAHLGAVIALYGAWIRRNDRTGRLLIALCVAFPLAYIPFWGIHISSLTSRISGPIYYLPMYVPVSVLLVEGVVALRRARPRLLPIAVVAAVVITIPMGLGRLGLNRHLSRIQSVWADASDELDNPAVAVISPSTNLLFLDPNSMTRPDRDPDLVYATDEDPELIRLVTSLGRPAHLLRPSEPAWRLAPSEETPSFDIDIEPIVITRGAAPTLDIEYVPDRSGVVVVDVDSGDAMRSLPPRTVTAGEAVQLRVRLGIDADTAGPDGLVIDPSGAIVEITAGVGDDAATARDAATVRHRLLVDGLDEIRILQPGRFERLDRTALADGYVHWLDDIDRGDLRVRIGDAEPLP